MILREEQGDLFLVPHGYYFAHCISGDFTLGAGIAVEFDRLLNTLTTSRNIRLSFCSQERIAIASYLEPV